MSYKIIDHYRLLLTISVYLFRIYSLKDESLCNLLIIQTCFSFVTSRVTSTCIQRANLILELF